MQVRNDAGSESRQVGRRSLAGAATSTPEATQPPVPKDVLSKAPAQPPEPTVKVRFKPQDDVLPDEEIEVPKSEVGTDLENGRFKIEEDPNTFQQPKADADGNYIFSLDDPRQGATNAFISANNALDLAKHYLGRDIQWGFKREKDHAHLWIHPHAGKGLNAFYSNENGSLNFLYDDDGFTGSLVDSSTSMEVVSHETGHAILDGLRPHYIQGLDVSSSGFHEAFGDTIAMLASLNQDDVLEQLYQDTGGDLSQPNIVSKMGEQLGRAMRGPKKDYVRNLLNEQKYRDARFLPFMAFPEGQALEPHAYSQVWSGAMYDAFRVLTAKESDDSSKTFIQSAKAARDVLGRLVMRSMEFAPPGKISYKTAAASMLKADMIDFGAAHMKELLAVFTMRDIFTKDDASKFMAEAEQIQALQGDGGLKLPAGFDPATDAKQNGGQQLLADKAKLLGLSDADVKDLKYGGCTINDQGERILIYNQEKKVTLEDPEWGATYQGNTFTIYGGLLLAFDKDGNLETLTRDPITSDDVADGKFFLRKMIDFQNNPPIVIKTGGKDDEKDDAHLQYIMASAKNPVKVVDGTVMRSGILY